MDVIKSPNDKFVSDIKSRISSGDVCIELDMDSMDIDIIGSVMAKIKKLYGDDIFISDNRDILKFAVDEYTIDPSDDEPKIDLYEHSDGAKFGMCGSQETLNLVLDYIRSDDVERRFDIEKHLIKSQIDELEGEYAVLERSIDMIRYVGGVIDWKLIMVSDDR